MDSFKSFRMPHERIGQTQRGKKVTISPRPHKSQQWNICWGYKNTIVGTLYETNRGNFWFHIRGYKNPDLYHSLNEVKPVIVSAIDDVESYLSNYES